MHLALQRAFFFFNCVQYFQLLHSAAISPLSTEITVAFFNTPVQFTISVPYMTNRTLISNDNSVEKEIQRRILAGNRTYFAAISLFRS